MSREKQRYFTGVVVLSIFMAGGCATPIGVTSLGRDYAYDQIDRSALDSRDVSGYTTVVLHRYNLERLSAKDPVRCLIELHQRASTDNRRDTLFALAELSFLQGKKDCRIITDGRKLAPENFFAASAVYAYFYLLGPGEEAPPDAFDRRFRMACDFYNRGLGYVIASRESRGPTGDVKWLLPVGSILIHPGGGASDIIFPLAENETFVSADRFQIRGLSVRNRNAGLGSPIVIVRQRDQGAGMTKTSAATVFLRVHGGLSDLAKGTLKGDIEILSSFTRDHVEVGGQSIPLEEDLTMQIAYSLNDPFLWQVKKKLFRLGQSPFDPGIYPAQPYQRGKIPVLFVHGTMSSPLLWAEMWNTLIGDRALREQYQFWFYLYDSAKPVGQSAVHLRESIETTVKKMDPDGQDPMMRQMVVIGHSQGGLLTKLTATATGETLIRAATGKTLSELALSADEERIVRRLAVFEPLPQVKRVVFISTPHRGSYQAGNFARSLARRFLSLPKQALQATGQLLMLAPKMGAEVTLASTSIDSMSPGNPAALALADLPVAPPIKAHSIIAVKGNDIPPKGGDGVVKYTSAHIAGVESELVVRSGHSCQGNPTTIEEVRRILLEHIQQINASSPSVSTPRP